MTVKSVGTPRSISEEARLQKNKAIAEAQKQTREKRKRQTCKVFELKIRENKLTRPQREALFMLFVEAKWLYNHCLASEDVFGYTAGHSVDVKLKDGTLETREFRFLGSQMKQSVVDGIRSSIKTLSTLKTKGKKVGRLRFITDYHSLNLKQFGTTYRFRGNKVKVQNVPGWMRVYGLEQLKGYEPANAKLVSRPSGTYLKVTAYIDNEDVVPQAFDHGTVIGIDMGVKTHFTLSDGRKIDVLVGETGRLKRLQRKFSRQQEGSNNQKRTLAEIRKEYEKMDRIKDEQANKLVRELLTYETVIYQDENLSSWRRKKGYVKGGKRLQHSILGRVKSRLSRSPRTVMLDRYQPTTQRCVCGTKTKHHVKERTFVCSGCGLTEDRDVHAAGMMIVLANEQNLLNSTCGSLGN